MKVGIGRIGLRWQDSRAITGQRVFITVVAEEIVQDRVRDVVTGGTKILALVVPAVENLVPGVGISIRGSLGGVGAVEVLAPGIDFVSRGGHWLVVRAKHQVAVEQQDPLGNGRILGIGLRRLIKGQC